jgi:hypothetical protein
MIRRARVIALIVALVNGCSSSSDAPDPADAATTADAADANGEQEPVDAPADDTISDAGRTLFGVVLVELFPETYTGFLASFFDGPVPPLLASQVRQEQAGCQLLVPRAACVPACTGDAVCTGTNTCTPQPKQVDVGTLHVTGLGGMDHDVAPTAPNVLTYQIVPSLPYPSCAEGSEVKISATGFAATSKCISALTVTSPAPIAVTAGQPMRLDWTPPGRAGISRIQIELEISHHGGWRGQIECDVPDSGSFEIPAPLITALVNLGRAGYPTVKVVRTATAAAPTQPGVKLTVLSRVETEVDTGVVSCGAGNSPPCPAGRTCQVDFTCAPMK